MAKQVSQLFKKLELADNSNRKNVSHQEVVVDDTASKHTELIDIHLVPETHNVYILPVHNGADTIYLLSFLPSKGTQFKQSSAPYRCPWLPPSVVKVLLATDDSIFDSMNQNSEKLLLFDCVKNTSDIMTIIVQSDVCVKSIKKQALRPVETSNQYITDLLHRYNHPIYISNRDNNDVSCSGGVQCLTFVRLCPANVNTCANSGRTVLMLASQSNDIYTLRCVLHQRPDIECTDITGETALMYAVKDGAFEVVQMLLAEGANVQHKNILGETTLMISSGTSSVDIMHMLIVAGADIHTKNDRGDTALVYSARANSHHCANMLVLHGADVNTTNETGVTPLMHASFFGSLESQHFLLQQGARIDETDTSQNTALLYAVVGCKLDAVRLLLDHGADITIENTDRRNAIMVAIEHQAHDVLALLLQHNAHAHIDYTKVESFLHFACTSAAIFPDIIQLLLNSGQDINAKNNDGQTSLILTANVNIRTSSKSTVSKINRCVKLLLESGANVDKIDYNGDTALHCATRQNNIEVVKTLLSRGSSCNAFNHSNQTALMLTVVNNATDIVKLLLDNAYHESMINIQDTAGNTALMYACKANAIACIDILISKGAVVNIPNDVSETPLMVAASKNYSDIVSALICHGANIYQQDAIGNTALTHAVLHNAVRCCNILITHLPWTSQLPNRHGLSPFMIAVNSNARDTFDIMLQHIIDLKQEQDLFIHAATSNSVDVLLAMLDKGVGNYEQTNEIGQTVLMLSAFQKCSGAVEILLTYDKHVNRIDNIGKTALFYACEGNSVQSAQLLIDRGASVNEVNLLNQTPLSLACELGCFKIIKFLLEQNARITTNQIERTGQTPLTITNTQHQEHTKRGDCTNVSLFELQQTECLVHLSTFAAYLMKIHRLIDMYTKLCLIKNHLLLIDVIYTTDDKCGIERNRNELYSQMRISYQHDLSTLDRGS